MPMPLGNCTRCGKLFNRLSRPICSDCIGEEQEQVELVMDYLRDSPNATIEEISQATAVDAQIVLRLIRDERLKATPTYVRVRNCRACGAPIAAGQYCGPCLRKFDRALSSAVGPGSGAGDVRSDGPGDVGGAARGRGELSDADRARTRRMVTPERRRRGR